MSFITAAKLTVSSCYDRDSRYTNKNIHYAYRKLYCTSLELNLAEE